jgi:hypothetical protein
MNHLRMFFTVAIEDTGFLASIGNYFLLPAHLFFNGKTVRIKKNQNIAKVSTYTLGLRFSKQDQSLYSNHFSSANVSDSSYDSTKDIEANGNALKYTLLTILFIPSLIMGTVFKGLSYCFSDVRKAHYLVKERLTPRDIIINDPKDTKDSRSLRNKIHEYLITGMKTRALVISAPTDLEDPALDYLVSWEIERLNPSKLILKGLTLHNHLNLKNAKWEKSVLGPKTVEVEEEYEEEDCEEDYEEEDQEVNEVKHPYFMQTIDEAIKAKHRPRFFGPSHAVFRVRDGEEEVAFLKTSCS